MSEGSVFLAALGSDAERLHPAVRRYVAGPPVDGLVGVGDGVFDVAGSRFRRLNLLLLPFVGRRLLMSAFERDVPFTVVNRPVRAASRDAPRELRAERTFRFSMGPQVFVDSLVYDGRPNMLRNVLGDAGRVRVELGCSVTADGELSLRSCRVWISAGPVRLRLRGPFAIHIDVIDGFDEASDRQTIRATVRNPLAGTVLEYRGSFTYRYEPEAR